MPLALEQPWKPCEGKAALVGNSGEASGAPCAGSIYMCVCMYVHMYIYMHEHVNVHVNVTCACECNMCM